MDVSSPLDPIVTSSYRTSYFGAYVRKAVLSGSGRIYATSIEAGLTIMDVKIP